MPNKPDWKNCLDSKENLLARFLSAVYLIPPAVNKTPAEQPRSLIARFNLPLSRAKRYAGRAADLCENANNEPAFAVPSPQELAIDDGDGGFAADSDYVVLDAESDPARSSKLGSGPGAKSSGRECQMHWQARASLACSIIELADYNCCCCDCDCCRKLAREWLLPRAAGSYKRAFNRPARLSANRLKLIRDQGDCVLGVLACGYVLSGSGSVKSGARKRA